MNINTLKTRFGIVGHNPRLISNIEVALQVAPTDVNVLINGENGTGKDVFSRIIHQFSKRKHDPFIAINCGAIPEGTMDSELFGHEKGSFTSAYESRKGYFEEVNGGTIFLDEIAEMPLATQSRLLRLLESGEYLRVGSSKIQRADVRVVAATNKNLIEMIRMGRFREDLYFRLNTVTIKVPPLRERGDDIELLFRYFANEFADKYNRNPLILEDAAAHMLYDYRWPGNVRELRNFAEKLTVLIDHDIVTADELADHLNITESYLPSVIGFQGANQVNENANPAREIEILYKLIFDLKQEVSDLKNLVFMGVRNGGVMAKPQEQLLGNPPPAREQSNFGQYSYPNPVQPQKNSPPLLEESLSLEKKEKEMINKALQKHRNNRKKAAQELGISERTLYRKINYYDLA
ncbi:MAG: sigma-54-dependent Fis family transcriptional regulator [Bacteroidia bacterium]|nr:sigma-54-dependent Fis family transcriptional regulator [Bacteroidia bacterium]